MGCLYTLPVLLALQNNDAPVFSNLAGMVSTGIGSATSVAVQLDGKILSAGTARILDDDDFYLTRYNIDGSLDQNFGVNGTITTNFSFYNVYDFTYGNRDIARSVIVQSDGKILLAGDTFAMLRP